jgi:glutaconyl-CoA/methylmalonyl-CoA decarboxylase subunit gamma
LGTHRFVIDGQSFEVQVHSRSAATADVSVNGKLHRVQLGDVASSPAAAPRAVPAQPRARSGVGIAAPGELRAPMAGLVMQTPTVGQRVHAGDALIVLDAMKMENTLAAPRDGVVQEVAVSRGESVLRGALLVRLG